MDMGPLASRTTYAVRINAVEITAWIVLPAIAAMLITVENLISYFADLQFERGHGPVSLSALRSLVLAIK